MMCEGSDDEAKCKKSITQGLMCTSFLDKAKQMDPNQVDGLGNFIQRCESIERQVPNLSSVMHWVQNPETVFNQAVSKAEASTGVKLGSPLGDNGMLGAVGDGLMQNKDNSDVPSDESLGLPPINAEA